MENAGFLSGHASRVPLQDGRLRLQVAAALNDYDEPLRWLAAWLHPESEGDIFAYGKGGGSGEYPVPPGAIGYRLRRWHSEGVAPEYEDWLFDVGAQ